MTGLLCLFLQLMSSCEYDPGDPGNCMSYSAVIYKAECGCEEYVNKSCSRNVSITEEQYDCLKQVLDASSEACYFFESISCLPGEEGGYLTSVVAFQDFLQDLTCID